VVHPGRSTATIRPYGAHLSLPLRLSAMDARVVSYQSSAEALAELQVRLQSATDQQLAIAKAACVQVDSGLPQLIVAVQLREKLQGALGTTSSMPANDGLVEWLSDLAQENGEPTPVADSRDEVKAWISYFYLRMREAAHRRLRLHAGDLVRVVGAHAAEIDEFSSISGDGTVRLRGRGARGWPDVLEVIERAGVRSDSAASNRRIAANRAASRIAPSWSGLRHDELAPFETSSSVERSELEELANVIDQATDERPIQLYLQEHAHILGSLLRGPERYVLPQVRLSTHYVADFLISDVDSTGVRWLYVELERPASAVAQLRANSFDKYARKGISQIDEWRDWVQTNLAHAHRSKRSDGLGLFDLRPNDDGLVLIGRRALLTGRHEALRRRLWEDKRIMVHTYDWLLEQVAGAMNYAGIPAANPYLLKRPPG